MSVKPNEISEIDLLRTLFEGKWRFDIIRNLCNEPKRLSALERLMPQARKKMLIDTLHALEDLGWVHRSDLSRQSKWVEYSLSAEWSDRIELTLQKITDEEIRKGGEVAGQTSANVNDRMETL
ncbi:winged helix-turn-helix transcriptional regulator [Granulicella paludicola]|uniref:winged helix-turn-helix transcriptional regulator n=1 Tax=Granulicella paludicola TaxID=474951 RepID=UPI0021E060B4|nr:winged helix-turn-helix transcriptional regulator [Granulicella paludicola]